MTGEEPFKEMNFTEMKIMVIEERARPKIPDHTSEKLTQLLKTCWHQLPEKRPPFSEVEDRLSHLIGNSHLRNSHNSQKD